MKARTLIMIALVAVMATGCRDIKRQINEMMDYPTSAESVAEWAETMGCDAALVVDAADTQYVLYRRYGHKNCFAMRYVMLGYPRDWKSSGGEFRLSHPEQPMVLNRISDNALTLTVADTGVIYIDSIAATDSALTFRFGIDSVMRPAKLYLYGKARRSKDPLAETSIQQMILCALVLDSTVIDDIAAADSVQSAKRYERYHTLSNIFSDGNDDELEMAVDEAEEEMNAAIRQMDSIANALTYDERYAECRHLDSLASELGLNHREIDDDGTHITLTVSGGVTGGKKCYARMERMAEEAGHCHTREYSVGHTAWHKRCTFTARW